MGSFEDALAQGFVWALLVAFGSGVATSFTPCVYPMIPITVSIFGARESRSRGTSFLLATAYVLGIAVMYAGLGMLAALAGWAATGALLSSPWFVVPLGVLFVALATSMLGLWELRLPSGLQARMAAVGGKGFRGAFAMGLVGGILIAPCTGPWLAGLLGYVATTGNVLLGGSLLFTYALGIGVLFWLIATFAVSLPKSGPWMDAVRSALGVALLVATLFYLQNVLSPLARYTSGKWSFAALNAGLVLIGILVGALHLQYHGQGLATAARKTMGVVAMTIGLFGLVNFALTPDEKLPWVHQEARALQQARKARRPVLVDFSASWCVPCKDIEANVLGDLAVRRELERFVLLKIDVTHDTPRDRRLQAKYRARELPQLVVLDPRGNEAARMGKVSVAQMLRILRRVQ